ncbi:BamA/TamA family outer membrane protein [Agarivorans sp. MS3-6]|uniref:BamA/TamA family outer membrane protein n=1 Tax=Agarivorans sp. TSD2052 TaxID=2937286 RepID=UPI00200F6FC7|nr:BamA/TamA family outer membrane protein [Agarivorans sp. TSD2052]UPW17060.1 BamA/TamA family outer membrane protein [Agarivorans sp. TSD2052]
MNRRLNNPELVNSIPPSVTGVVGAGTSNGTKIAGLFHSGNWDNDNVRYLGGLFTADINLKYYASSNALGTDLSMKGHYFFQEIDFRLGDSNFFAGAEYTYMASEATIGMPNLIPDIKPMGFNSKDAGMALKLSYDSTDNPFAPRQGLKTAFKAKRFDQQFGGDFNYDNYSAYAHGYHRLSSKWGLNVRADMKSVSKGAPFYAKPFIDMRGIAAMRYQADNTAVAELEVTYDIDSRWTLLAFAGTGKAFDHNVAVTNTNFQGAQGGGVRYLLSRQLGLRAGVDVAKGPEEWALYFQLGSSW